jgi:hypothetical protein
MCRFATNAVRKTKGALKASSLTRLAAVLLTATALPPMLGGCSDLYLDRRDSIAPFAGNAIAANEAVQTVDPWPPQSGNANIAFNGQRMTSAVERYLTEKEFAPVDPMAPQAAGAANQGGSGTPSGGSGSGSPSSTSTLVISTPAAATAATPSQ